MTKKKKLTTIKITPPTRTGLRRLKVGGESYDALLKRKLLNKKTKR